MTTRIGRCRPGASVRPWRASVGFECLEQRLALTTNLRVESLYLSGANGIEVNDTVVGEQIQLSAKWLANVESKLPVAIEFLIDGEHFQTVTKNADSTTESYRSTTMGWYARPGQHILEVRLDADNSISEDNESDNVATISFTPQNPVLPNKFLFPLGGLEFRDWYILNYHDTDARKLYQEDFRGGPFQLDGHEGMDISLTQQFHGMDQGVAVYAVADGVVIGFGNGNFDRNTAGLEVTTDSNFVYIDHGNGIETDYLHLATGTVTVTAGERVKAGQLLGYVGSSGRSTGPHLHFAVYRIPGDRPIETNFARETYWANPIPYSGDLPTTIVDSGITNYAMTSRFLEERYPSDSKEAVSSVREFPVSADWDMVYWSFGMPFKTNDRIEVRWLRPDGSLEYAIEQIFSETEPNQIALTSPFVSRTWALGHERWSQFTGTWHVVMEVNGNEVDRQAVEVTSGPGTPELRLLQDEQYIIDGRSTAIDFGSSTNTNIRTKVFTIQNHGSTDLVVGDLSLPPGFSLVGDFPARVSPGTSADFTVQLDSDTNGRFFGQIRFQTNDADESDFDFNVQGNVTGSAPAGSPRFRPLVVPAVVYSTSAEPTPIAPRLTVGDDDSLNFNTGELIVEFASGQTSDDRLAIRNQGTDVDQIGIIGRDVSYGGLIIGRSIEAVPDRLVIALNANATLAAIQALVRNVTYFNVSDQPATNHRYLRLKLIDDTGKSSNLQIAHVVFDLRPIIGSGDLNGDGEANAFDVDLLFAAIRMADVDPKYDLNRDSFVDQSDIDELIEHILESSYGDANLDKVFDSADLAQVFQAAQYEDALIGNSRWSTGDWDGDGEFTSEDLVLAFQKGGYHA